MRGSGKLPSFSREIDMYKPVLTLFSFGYQVAEVPFFKKRIDIVVCTSALLSLYAIELKLTDWRTGFKQAAINQLGVQRSFLALPAALAERVATNEHVNFSRHDVGLISVGDHANILIRPRKSTAFHKYHYHKLKTTLSQTTRMRPQNLGVVSDAIANRKKSLVVLQAWPNKRKGAI